MNPYLRNPLITVCTPCYNQGKYLPEMIESVLGQKQGDFEYLLIDDGSTDDTFEVMTHYAGKDSRIIVVKLPKQPNVGPVLNLSIRMARGKYWVWGPADDVFMSNLLETKVRDSKKWPCAVIYHGAIVIDSEGKEISRHPPRKVTHEEFKKLVWKHYSVPFTGIWIPLSAFKFAGPFPEHLKYSEDYWWKLKAVIHGIKFVGSQRLLHKKRRHSDTTSERFRKDLADGVLRIKEELLSYQKFLNGVPSE